MPCTRSVKYISNSFGAESLVGLEDKGQRFTGLDLLDGLNLQPLQDSDLQYAEFRRIRSPEDRRDSAQLHHSVLLMC